MPLALAILLAAELEFDNAVFCFQHTSGSSTTVQYKIAFGEPHFELSSFATLVVWRAAMKNVRITLKLYNIHSDIYVHMSQSKKQL
jgi:hypothetical protein